MPHPHPYKSKVRANPADHQHRVLRTAPFYLPAVLTAAAIDLATGAWNWGNPIFLAVAILNWWMMRNDKDDDDRWRRRREKLAAKVEEAGGRLVVVPVGSNA